MAKDNNNTNKKQKIHPIPQQVQQQEEEEEEDEENYTSSEEEEEEDEDKQIADTKTELAAQNSTFKIKEIGENPERSISPIVGYFSSGYDPLSNSGISVYKSAKSRNPANPRMELVVGTSNPHLNFVGTNYSGEATAPQLCNYALGVLDKESGVLKMVPIAANRVFRLMPKVPGVPQDDEPPTEQVVIDHEQRHTFSAKKDIDRDKKKVTLHQSETAGDRMGVVMKLGGATNAEALASTTDASFFHAQNLPPHNLDATTPDMAYPLDRIIHKGEWDCLLDVYELVQSGSELKPTDYPIFVRNRISKLEDLKDESQRKRMAAVLSYMTHLIKFRDKHSMDHFKTAKYHKFPGRLMQRFTSMFDATHERRIPDNKLVLLINYIVVLSLIVDDFSSDPADIAKDLHMKVTDIRTHYGYLGCKMKGTCSTLPLPLKLQTVTRNKKRK